MTKALSSVAFHGDRFRATSRDPHFRALLGALRATLLNARTTDTLAAVLLIEMTERSRLRRGAEWALWATGGVLHLPRRVRPKTLGPFQLRDAPRTFREAASQAASLIDGAGSDRDVARRWYGAASRQRGACISYEEALSMARGVIDAMRESRLSRTTAKTPQMAAP